jgi:hypothetical protein
LLIKHGHFQWKLLEWSFNFVYGSRDSIV